MRQHILDPHDFAPARAIFDNLVLDPDIPLTDQLDDLDEDLFAAGFPNNCILAIGWFPAFKPDGEFGVSLNQNPEWWDSFAERRCRSIPALKQAVADLAEIARQRKERYLFSGREMDADFVWANDLVLDPSRPPQDQPAVHKARLFEVYIGQYVLRIDWSAPGSPSGEFVVSLKYMPRQWEFRSRDLIQVERRYEPETWQPVLERRCRTVAELQAAVSEFVGVVWRDINSVRRELGLPERSAE